MFARSNESSVDSSAVTEVPLTLLGCGTVGGGVLDLLRDRGDDFAATTGHRPTVRHVLVRDLERHRSSRSDISYTDDANVALGDADSRIVVELIGGIEPARSLILKALGDAKHVVTANKALLAAHGPELFAAARANGVSLAFEASCGGGIPIVGALTGGLLANRIDALVGILNGTSNVILSAMSDRGETYDSALAAAQEQGFAEADPTLDVSGRDAAQKLAILAGLAMGARLNENDVHVEGIAGIDPVDIDYARDLGYAVKLLATARREEAKVALSVFPGLLAAGDPMADVDGPFNAVSAYGHATGHAMLVGRGAGKLPTASAVVADVLQVALGAYPLLFSRLRRFPDAVDRGAIMPFEQTRHRYYLRLTVTDRPGVFAEVTRCLGDAGISLSAVLQREAHGEHVPIVVTTHEAIEGDVQEAVGRINALSASQAPAVVLRIVDMPRETFA